MDRGLEPGATTGKGASLPDAFGDPQCLRWRSELDPGHGTPVVGMGRLFAPTFRRTATSGELALVALDAATGRVVWRREVVSEKMEDYHRSMGNPAQASPACDGERVFAFFGSRGLLCFDREGKTLWEYRAGPFRDEYGSGSSPVLVDGKVILQQDHDIDSFLAALDAATGKLLWKTARPDAVRSYATPAVWERSGKRELLVAGALELAGYDLATGEKSWWVRGLARIVIPSPVPVGDTIFMASWAPGGDAGQRFALDAWPAALAKWDRNANGKLARAEIESPEVLDRFYRMDLNQDGELDQAEWERHAEVFRRAQNAVLAVRPGVEPRGELPGTAVVWKHGRGVPYVPSPVVDPKTGIYWMVKDGGIVTKLDIRDGAVLQEERLPGLGNYYASPVLGDGKVYFASEQGVVSVLAASREWNVIGSHKLEERIYASPVIRDGAIFLRTERAMYRFQRAQGQGAADGVAR